MDTIKEADVQRACLEYLDAKRIMYLRLNSGDVFRPGASGKMYRVKGCPKGTADLLILQCTATKYKISLQKLIYTHPRPIFVEFKSSKGKVSQEQEAFNQEVTALGYEYHIVRSLDDLIEVLK